MKSSSILLGCIFFVFLVLNAAYLPTVPGIMGDEAHEGENVFHMLDSGKIEVVGERSYIGPLIDYVRIPFVIGFGYSALALRALMFVVSVGFFALSAYILRKFLGEDDSSIPLLFLAFSPIYLTQQRLGWAITLLPFFAVLLILALQSSWKQKYLLAGLIAGVGLSTHLLFLPSLVAIMAIAGFSSIRKPKRYLAAWPFLIGFIAGFSMQFAILQLFPDDQGSQKVIAETVMDRVSALPVLLPEILSGSSYIASYIGQELSVPVKMTITSTLGVLVLIALSFSKHRKVSWILFVGLLIHLGVLLRIIDRFSLRYFVVFVLGIWLLSGIGLSAVIAPLRARLPRVADGVSALVCALFVLWAVTGIFIPYTRTGGSTNIFSLGNRTDSAAALVDTTELLSCLKDLGPVYSENVHIYNRMIFWSRQYPGIQAVNEDYKHTAKYLVDYRIPENPKLASAGTICSHLDHFRIVVKK